MTTSATRRAPAPAGDLWAITSYYNPLAYRRRRENYRIFRQRLKVPLLTVELAYGPDFELWHYPAITASERVGLGGWCSSTRRGTRGG